MITDQNGRLIRYFDFLPHNILTIPLGTPNITYNILKIPPGNTNDIPWYSSSWEYQTYLKIFYTYPWEHLSPKIPHNFLNKPLEIPNISHGIHNPGNIEHTHDILNISLGTLNIPHDILDILLGTPNIPHDNSNLNPVNINHTPW